MNLIVPDRQLAKNPDASNKMLAAESWLKMTIEERRKVFRELRIDPFKMPWIEKPVSLATFISGQTFLYHPPLSDVQYAAVEATTELFTADGDLRKPQKTECVLMWGKGGGKDTIAKIMFARIAYLLGCLTDPLATLGIANSSHVDLLNIAVSEEQATHVFFNPLKRMLLGSEWFTQRLTFTVRAGSIHFPPKIEIPGDDGIVDRREMYAINGYSGNSEQEAQEGLNLLLAVLDEIDAFMSRAESGNRNVRRATITADSLYDMSMSSAQSRFPGVGKVVLMSWPRYQGSFIMRRYAEGLNEPSVYASKAATWEANPTKTRSMFDDEFRRNPERARAKYSCTPPKSGAPFFGNSDLVRRQFFTQEAIGGELRPISEGVPSNPGGEAKFVLMPGDGPEAVMEITSRLRPEVGTDYFWHGDLAKNGDRAALAMAHFGGWFKSATNIFFPRVVLDCIVWWNAPGAGKEIDFAEARRLMLCMARAGFGIRQVTFDGWQSVDMIQQMRRYGRDGEPSDLQSMQISSTTFSVDTNLKAYTTLKDLIYGGRLDAFYEPLLVDELLSLQLVNNGKKVDHPADGGKDISDSVAGVVTQCVLNGGAPPGPEAGSVDFDGFENLRSERSGRFGGTSWRRERQLRERKFR